MTTYILYEKLSGRIRRIDSVGSVTSDGPSRGSEAYSSDPDFVNAHAVWKLPVAFFQKLRIDVLHGIGVNADVIFEGGEPVGIKVHDRPTLKDRRKIEVLESVIADMVEKNSLKRRARNVLIDNPTLSNKTPIQELETEMAAAEALSITEYERIVAGGDVPLTPLLDARAGEEIKLNG